MKSMMNMLFSNVRVYANGSLVLSLLIASRNATEAQGQIFYDGQPRSWADYYILIYTHCWQLMKSVGSCGSSSLLFMMKVKVRHFVGDSHKGYDRLIVVSPSNCCCGDFSAISYIYMYVCMPMVRYIDGTLSSTYLRSIN